MENTDKMEHFASVFIGIVLVICLAKLFEQLSFYIATNKGNWSKTNGKVTKSEVSFQSENGYINKKLDFVYEYNVGSETFTSTGRYLKKESITNYGIKRMLKFTQKYPVNSIIEVNYKSDHPKKSFIIQNLDKIILWAGISLLVLLIGSPFFMMSMSGIFKSSDNSIVKSILANEDNFYAIIGSSMFLIMAILSLVLIPIFLKNYIDELGTKDWPKTKGKVLFSEINYRGSGSSGSTIELDFFYEYFVNSKKFIGKGRYLSKEMSREGSKKDYQEFIDQYPKDSEIEVTYKKSNPNKSLILAGEMSSKRHFTYIFTIVMLTFGLIGSSVYIYFLVLPKLF